MTQQYPPQPLPGDAPQPSPPKKSKKWLYIALGAAVFLVIGIAASSNGGEGTSEDPAVSESRPSRAAEKDTGEDKKELSPREAFQAYVVKHGTESEKGVIAHVVKVQGADRNNDILDTAEIHTDYSGDLMSEDAASGKLIASAFTDWQASRGKESKNGLVTVYNRSGEILSNGNY